MTSIRLSNSTADTNPADARFARAAWIRALERTASIERNPDATLPTLVQRWREQYGAAPALLSRDAVWSYRDLAAACDAYARFGLAQGLRPGDVAALVMPNCVEYLAVWLGLTGIGAAVALVNTHLTGDALAHSMRIVAPKVVIAGAAAAAAVSAVRPLLPGGTRFFMLGKSAVDMQPLEEVIEHVGVDPLLPSEYMPPTIDDVALYIYTSGTTGLPKAARVSHYRLMQWSHWFAGLMDTGPGDRMYDCLPLYHSVGGIVATGATLVGGGAVVLRERFSAADFWRDIRAERCTLFQYIGELCRYLVNSPPADDDGVHDLRIACGNGLRPEVWGAFKTRFRIPRILEYYAATEGNFSLYNCEGQPGSIGRIPPFLTHRLPVALLRIDDGSGEPLRNSSGLCEAAAANEIGEAVGRMPGDGAGRAGRFEGYADAQASERKILRNVLEAGDAWYRTGDLMYRDERGFYYFVDRVGETFRWKGENVATAEVRNAVMGARGVRDAVVYGVAVPDADGKAGMAALVVDRDFDLAEFRAHVAALLPAYARPLIVRLMSAIGSTATFKPKARALAQEGFDPARIADALYLDDRRAAAFVRIDSALYTAIGTGAVRL